MAKEYHPPTGPLTPRKNDQPQRPSNQPEFGKPSPLRPAHPQARPSTTHPFNIPKPNRTRPEHHRPAQGPRPNSFGQPRPAPQGYRPAAAPGGATPFTPGKRREPFDPFKPVRPSEYHNVAARTPGPRDDGAVPIRRPENFTFNTPRAEKTVYSSKPVAPKMSNASKNLRSFIDLTKEGGFSPTVQPRNTGFGSMDVNGYVDAAKANENIKALLEGAFEDEDDKKPAKGTKKRKNKNRRRNKGKKEEPEPKEKSPKEESSDVDNLADQLLGVTVNDPKRADGEEGQIEGDGKNEESKESGIAENIGGSRVAHQEEDVSEAEEEEDDDEEEDEEEDYDDDGTVEGLKVKLLPHQRDGTTWMREKEIGHRNFKGVLPKGGILADDMGLGKTVQAITLILTNRKPTNEEIRKAKSRLDDTESDDSDGEQAHVRKLPPGLSKCTLVVAPLALIRQWESEIEEKVEYSRRLKVCVYHGASRTKAGDNLEDYDVVITTYGTLTSEHGAIDKNGKKSGLFSVYWYRVILDEAHTIKNRNAKASQSACALDAEYRWCLSGTPMQNNLDELQSLIKFLRIKPFNDLAAWKDQISRPLANGRGGLAIERLQVFLKAFMKRRTKDVLKLNDNLKPQESTEGQQTKSSGFQITKREVIPVSGEFTPAEMNFYKRLEQRTENSLEKMMGGSKIDYAGALVLLLRLRQSCNHPDLVKSDLAQDKDVLLQNAGSQKQKGQSQQDDLDSMADLFGGLSVVTRKCDVCQMDLSSSEAKRGSSRCSECDATLGSFSGAEKKIKPSTDDVVDLTDSPTVSRTQSQTVRSRRNRRVVMDSDDEEEAEWIVPENKRDVPDLGTAGGSDDEDAEGGGEWLDTDDSDTDDGGPESPIRNVKASASSKQNEPAPESEDDIYLDPGDDDNQVLPSTKIRHLMKILRNDCDDHKFIVFSVFTSMLDKIEPFLERAGIGFARYDGSMRNDYREASLNKLRHHRGTRVLLCSLRAGALGLNLTAASRVVILEPFWNPFVEEQAIDRVHRLNQTKDVKIYKLIIKETVEERILDLQHRKRELANLTIEGKSAAGKLTMNDMLGLFGRDAESRYTSKQGDLEFTQSTRLLSSNEFEPPSSSGRNNSQGSGGIGGRGRHASPPLGNRPSRTEDPVYGRRW